MSCWVVPSVAAEYWGIPLEQVLSGIRGGNVPIKRELGLTFVDVAPNSGPADQRSIPKAIRPLTFVAVPSFPAVPAKDDDAPLDYRPARRRVSSMRRPPKYGRCVAALAA